MPKETALQAKTRLWLKLAKAKYGLKWSLTEAENPQESTL